MKKSHIIPDFLFRSLYDESHKIIVIPTEYLFVENYRPKSIPTGEYDSNILCSLCENQFSKYETYANYFLFSEKKPNPKRPYGVQFKDFKGLTFTKIKSVDYDKFKLFFLSLLWRFHITSRELFKSVDLGKHAETLRKMLIDQNPGKACDFPIFIIKIETNNILFQNISTPMLCYTRSGANFYLIIMRGYFYCFFINFDHIPQVVKYCTLQPNGSFVLMHMPENMKWENLSELYQL